ncbi:MAG: hypothetical protein JKX76_15510 [Colwellia sp.]|nr:hypothetical protein [Colwellia sp.]
MSTKEGRHKIFIDTLVSLPISQGGLAKWMYLEDTKLTRKYVSRKNTGEVAVTTSDIALLQVLAVLEEDGYDLKSIEFSEFGEITQLEKK